MDMEELLGFIPAIIIFLAVMLTSGKKNNKAKKQAPPKQTAQSGKKPDARSIGKAIAAEKKKEAKKPVDADSAPQGVDPCHEDMLGPREEQMEYRHSSEAELAEAGEGEDPCHVGYAAETHVDEEPHEDNDRVFTPGAVGDAIVMAEILKRPAERRRERPRYRYGKAANE